MSRIHWYGPTLLLLVTLVLTMLLGPGMVRMMARTYEATRVEEIRHDLVNDPALATLSESFKKVANVVRPSVTSISLQARDRNPSSPTHNRMVGISNGSGWVYRHYDGNDTGRYSDFIITNHHVVADLLRGRAEQVIVRFDNGGEYHAQVVGTDPKTDVAVLKIKQNGLIPAAVAQQPAEQGEIVFAVGSPFQFDFSMSQGIVSATGRQLHDYRINSYENFIQTDAAINPGNSGGPLTNVKGEVIGMNTAIAIDGDPAEAFSGLGFAIPVDQVINVADQIIERGEVRRGYIGVVITDIDFATARELGFVGKGVLCEPVPGDPADVAGLQLGDIITHVDRQAVSNGEELRIAVSSHPPGDEVPIRVWRMGRTMTLKMTLGEVPSSAWAMSRRRSTDNANAPAADSLAMRVGLGRLESLTPALAADLGWAYTPGVLIRLIEHASPADRARIDRMTVITAVDGRPVRSLEDFADAIDGANPRSLKLTIKRWNPSGDGQYDEREVELSAQ